MQLTKRQQEVFDFICEEINTQGSAPTRAEIAKRMGFRSPNAAEDHLRALARKGVIELVSSTSRGIRLKKINAFVTLPSAFPDFHILAGDQLVIQKKTPPQIGDLVLVRYPQNLLEVTHFSETLKQQVQNHSCHLEGLITALSRSISP